MRRSTKIIVMERDSMTTEDKTDLKEHAVIEVSHAKRNGRYLLIIKADGELLSQVEFETSEAIPNQVRKTMAK